MFGYKVVNSALDNLLISGSEIFIDFSIKRGVNRNTKFSNLSSEERAALENLSKRKDLIVKAADKGGALVVWRADLYQKEALRQLSDMLVLTLNTKLFFIR